ncbi:MAG: SpoIIE family protein phosphatase [Candidatus Riflebacteria bacterium]|nr:SpoIIE family protein phosphatase [Candidatus Riflebacteria bacterium]
MAQMHQKDWEFLSIAVQFAILSACAVFGIDFWLAGIESRDIRTNWEKNRKQLTRVAVRCDPEVYVHSRLLSLSSRINRFDKSHEKILQRMVNEYKLQIQLYFYDFSGKCVKTWPAGLQSQKFFEKLYKSLIAKPGKELERMRKELDSRISLIFGEGKNLLSLQSAYKAPIEIIFRNENGLALWNRNDRGGVFIILEKIPDEKLIFRNIFQSGLSEGEVPQICGFGTRGEGKFFRFGKWQDKTAGNLFESMEKSSERRIESDNYEWIFLETSSGRIIYGAFPIFRENMQAWRKTIRLFGLAIFLSGCLFLRIFSEKHTVKLSRLVPGLFIVSASLPLFGIAFGSIDLMKHYREVINSRVRTFGESTLRNMVSNYDEYLGKRSAILNSKLAEVSSFSISFALNLQKEGLIDMIQARNNHGKLVFAYPEGSQGRSEVFQVSYSLLAIERYYPERLKGLDIKKDIFCENVVRSDDLDFSSSLNLPGRIQRIQIGNRRLLYYFKVNPPESGEIAFIEAHLSFQKGLEAYLKNQILQRKTFEGSEFRLYAVDTKNCQWILPPKNSMKREILAAALAGKTFGQAEYTSIESTGMEGSLICLACPIHPSVSLILYYPFSHIGHRITIILRGIMTVGILFSILLILISRVLSMQLISPMNTIAIALEALSKREFSHQIDHDREDEFGKLFNTFNNMMIEAKDLNLAKIVQEGLIPTSFPVSEGYSIQGKVLPASDLGGDILDSFRLGNGKICFIVGDIAGHGIAAALMMAFARAISFHESSKEGFTPEKLAKDMDTLLREHISFKVFLGMICGLLDPEKNQLDLLVSGMPFPILLTKGKVEFLGKPAFPLGAGKKAAQHYSISIDLKPGENLVCYSDGCIEAMNSKNQMLGYDGFTTFITNSINENSELIIDNIIDNIQKWRENKIYDDLTLFVLKRTL